MVQCTLKHPIAAEKKKDVLVSTLTRIGETCKTYTVTIILNILNQESNEMNNDCLTEDYGCHV